jgi:pilus assembly protein CpaF
MIRLTITETNGVCVERAFDKAAISIGRTSDNDLVLAGANVSKHHSRIVHEDAQFVAFDLQSTNGTFINGTRIAVPKPLGPEDRISIGNHLLTVVFDPKDGPEGPGHHDVLPANSLPLMSAVERASQLQKKVHDRLIQHLDLRRMDIDELGEQELRNRTELAVRDIIRELDAQGEIEAGIDRQVLLDDVLDEALGLGPLESLLADEDVSEVMVNHARQIFVERKGRLSLSEKTFSSNRAVLGVIERIVAPIGRRIDESSPLVDARLKDGSRVNAIIPPLALKGPCLTIRKFKKQKLRAADLVDYQSLTSPMAEFLEMAVRARENIVISGGTGSGKTTLLNVLTSFIPDDERIVTVEDSAELQVYQPHWVQLEARPPNLEGKGQIAIRDLVKNCLRMRPDRIVVGECRSGETLDMLQAMNTGHDGSLTTLHANSPRDALARMETMCLMAGMDLPLRAIREQIVSAVQLMIQQARFPDGSRRITHITEISGIEGEVITLQDIFRYQQEGFDESHGVKGRFTATGFIPEFCQEMQRRGVPVNLGLFREG